MSDRGGLLLLHEAATMAATIGKAKTIACYDSKCIGLAQIRGGSGKGRYRYECNVCHLIWSQERDTCNGANVRLVTKGVAKQKRASYMFCKCDKLKAKDCMCKREATAAKAAQEAAAAAKAAEEKALKAVKEAAAAKAVAVAAAVHAAAVAAVLKAA